ncbi:MAG: Cell division protein FtsW [candidate division CPR1 bacterium GW2011_GWA2_42_17]|uniref:Probable peptidoglycan glycosyltransferase FtsW n=1 Tax=candidate division CPR1 bacterium GW2011_GWA2_42_17 TaxID=1618341 RepID=A0A0G0Z575_9BACT|nr:MAG: Cell division protein FtsW [candidate division CPR1 bacterium GW2011_GWA2_42_17]
MTHEHSPNYFFIVLLFTLIVAGLFVLYSSSLAEGLDNFGSSTYYLFHQIGYGLLPGLLGFYIFFKLVPYQFLRKFALIFLAISLVLSLLVFVPHLGLTLRGATRWLSVGSLFSFQPAEILKFAMVFYFAAWLDGWSKKSKSSLQETVALLALLGIGGGILFMQNDLGTALVLSGALFFMYILSGVPWKYIGILFLILLAMGFIFLISDEYRVHRLLTFLNFSSVDPQSTGYQIRQALIAIGSGGVWGVGFGQSRQKFAYLPESTGDSIFAILAEELGFVGVLGTFTIFILFIWSGIKIAKGAPDYFGKFLTAGLIFLISTQFFLNVSAISGFLPLTGVPLPFISYGGTFLALLMSACGVIANVSKYSDN